jgi:hypothetical protein
LPYRLPVRACSVIPQSIWIEGIERVSIPSKSKSPPIHINPLQSIWIENNRTSPKGAEDNRVPSPFAASEQARSGDETSDGVSELSPTWIAKSFIPVGGCHCSWSSPRTHNFFCLILSRLCARQQGHAQGDRTRTHGRDSRAHTLEPLAAAAGRPRIAGRPTRRPCPCQPWLPSRPWAS